MHLLLAQERLELEGYRFMASPPFRAGDDWTFSAWNVNQPGEPVKKFDYVKRSDALANALQWAEMDSGARKANEQRDTTPAPAPEVAAE